MKCPHPDCGCRHGAPCCLNCPLAECVLITGPPDPWRHHRTRARAIATYNQSTTRTATRFGVSTRTVCRIRREHKIDYHREYVRDWNTTSTGRHTRAAWRKANPGRLAAYMRAWRTRALS